MDFLNGNVTISLNTSLLIIISLVILSLLVAVVFLVIKLKKETQYKPKYGFLGKTLYPAVTVALLVTGLVMTGISMNDQKIFEIKAQKQIASEIYTNILQKGVGEDLINLKATPSVDDKIWGQFGDKFDIYWDLQGPKEYSFIELKKTNEDRSGLQVYVVPGEYKVSITIVFEDSVYIFSKEEVF